MGRGDIRSKKGKITASSFGNSRMRKSNIKTTDNVKPVVVEVAEVAEATEAVKPKKTVKKTVKAKKK